MFTTAQAEALGVDRMKLSRLASHGQIERIAHGVYRAASAQTVRKEDIYATWLALNPERPA